MKKLGFGLMRLPLVDPNHVEGVNVKLVKVSNIFERKRHRRHLRN